MIDVPRLGCTSADHGGGKRRSGHEAPPTSKKRRLAVQTVASLSVSKL